MDKPSVRKSLILLILLFFGLLAAWQPLPSEILWSQLVLGRELAHGLETESANNSIGKTGAWFLFQLFEIGGVELLAVVRIALYLIPLLLLIRLVWHESAGSSTATIAALLSAAVLNLEAWKTGGWPFLPLLFMIMITIVRSPRTLFMNTAIVGVAIFWFLLEKPSFYAFFFLILLFWRDRPSYATEEDFLAHYQGLQWLIMGGIGLFSFIRRQDLALPAINNLGWPWLPPEVGANLASTLFFGSLFFLPVLLYLKNIHIKKSHLTALLFITWLTIDNGQLIGVFGFIYALIQTPLWTTSPTPELSKPENLLRKKQLFLLPLFFIWPVIGLSPINHSENRSYLYDKTLPLEGVQSLKELSTKHAFSGNILAMHTYNSFATWEISQSSFFLPPSPADLTEKLWKDYIYMRNDCEDLVQRLSDAQIGAILLKKGAAVTFLQEHGWTIVFQDNETALLIKSEGANR